MTQDWAITATSCTSSFGINDDRLAGKAQRCHPPNLDIIAREWRSGPPNQPNESTDLACTWCSPRRPRPQYVDCRRAKRPEAFEGNAII
jgi:hypothetical protein